MRDEELLRYSRHILLDDIGIEGQQKITESTVFIVGAGGLGSPVAMYLAASGVGHLVIADHDTVDLTNLQRQVAHRTESVGAAKVESMRQTLAAINPTVRITALLERAEGPMLDQWVRQSDVVIDCSDNFRTRHAVNAACVRFGIPLVSGAAIRFDGQISVYDTRDANAPCYACVFPAEATFEEVRCSTMGVFAPLVGIIGSMQASEALRLMAGVGRSLAGRLQMLDGRSMEWTEIRVPRHRDCPVCNTRAAHH